MELGRQKKEHSGQQKTVTAKENAPQNTEEGTEE